MVAGAIRSPVNPRGLQLECARILHELLLIHIMYGSKTMKWKEERSRIRDVKMDNLTGLCRVAKGVHESIDEGVL